MSGLIDSTTGLSFGVGLQFQTQIGTAGLDITSGTENVLDLTWGADALMWGALELTWDYPAAATSLFARMSPSPDATTKGLISDVISTLVLGGVWAKTDCLQVEAAFSQQASKLNWVADQYNATDGAVASTFTIDRGYAGNGSTSYLNSGFNAAGSGLLSSQHDCTMAYWRNDIATSSALDLGTLAAGSLWSTMGRQDATHVYAGVANGSSVGSFVSSDAQTLIAVSRTGATAQEAYVRGASVGTSSVSSGTLANGNIYLGGSNNIGVGESLYSPTTTQISAFYYGKALTAGEHQTLYSALAAYMNAIGNYHYPVACWGDSRTQGATQTPYMNQMSVLQTPNRWYYNGGVGGETSTQIATRMLASTTYVGDWIPIIWAGYNNRTDPAQVAIDIESMVDQAIAVNNGRYFVLTVPPSRVPGQYTGTSEGDNLAAINANIMSSYGDRAINVSALLCLGDPNGVMLAQYVINTVTDPIHLNTLGLSVVANAIKDQMIVQGW